MKNLDPSPAIPLYRSPRNDPENNVLEKSGTDLFARRAPDGTVSFWLRDWSGRSGETIACTPVPEDFAVRFIREMDCTGEAVTGLEHDNLVDYLPGLYWAAGKWPDQ